MYFIKQIKDRLLTERRVVRCRFESIYSLRALLRCLIVSRERRRFRSASKLKPTSQNGISLPGVLSATVPRMNP